MDQQKEIAALRGSVETLKEMLNHLRGLLKAQTARAEALADEIDRLRTLMVNKVFPS